MKARPLLTMTILAGVLLTAGLTVRAAAGQANAIHRGHADATAKPHIPLSGPVVSIPSVPTCHSRWCEKVRDVRRVTRRVQAGLAAFGRAHGSPSPMAAEALAITRAARHQGRSPFALLGIAGKESTFGTAPLCPAYGGGRWNTTGLGSCGHYWTQATFCRTRVDLALLRSYADGMRVTGLLIRCLLPRADTVYELYGYCSGCPTWSGDVAEIMRVYFRSGPGVRWRDAVEAVGR